MAAFIFVHGTFAKSARWPTLQAALAETASAAGEGSRFEQLKWTGKNRASARRAAASDIFAAVQKSQPNSPSEKVLSLVTATEEALLRTS